VACPHRLPKLPESTLRKQARPNNGSLFYSHCGVDSIAPVNELCSLYSTEQPLDARCEGHPLSASTWQSHPSTLKSIQLYIIYAPNIII
jgi:hypothetical protein